MHGQKNIKLYFCFNEKLPEYLSVCVVAKLRDG